MENSAQPVDLARSVVVDRHGGSIDSRTALGRGSSFTVRLLLDEAARVGAAPERFCPHE